MTFADVHAGVLQTLAAYTQALDDGRTDDVAGTYCEDGACDIAGFGAYEGRAAIRAAYAGWVPRRPQRHLVVNPVLTSWSEDEAAASSDVVLLVQGDGGWAVGVVGRYQDVLRRDADGAWRFWRRRATFVG